MTLKVKHFYKVINIEAADLRKIENSAEFDQMSQRSYIPFKLCNKIEMTRDKDKKEDMSYKNKYEAGETENLILWTKK